MPSINQLKHNKMITKKQINAYTYDSLGDKARLNVIFWMSSNFEPLDYEKEDGTIGYDYWEDMPEEYIQEHCEINGFLFNKEGEPVHHLIIN